MSRLIDADLLIDTVNKSTMHYGEHLWKQVVCDVINNQPIVRQPVKKKIVHDMGDKEEYCPICKIMLYDSFASKNDRRNQGIFDLANAKFCPKCGVEFE